MMELAMSQRRTLPFVTGMSKIMDSTGRDGKYEVEQCSIVTVNMARMECRKCLGDEGDGSGTDRRRR